MTVTRFVDRGAVFAGWVGLGMAVVMALGLELIVAVQALVFLFAPVAGLLIGLYANARPGRRRPWRRVLANSAWAGIVTALSLAILYGGLRLIFMYADSGYRDGTQGGPLECRSGPECTYMRYIEAGNGPGLEAAGVVDAVTFERSVLQEQLNGAFTLVVMVVGGAALGGALYGALGPRAAPAAELSEAPRPA